MHHNLVPVTGAVDFMENHLSGKIQASDVADALHYSKYHLHRMFRDTVGMTMHTYLQRRRLTEAARLLAGTRAPILDIALAAGYDTQQAFSAAFKAMYKYSPGRFRAEGRYYPLQLRFAFRHEAVYNWTAAYHSAVDAATEEDVPHWMDLVRLVVDG